MASLIYGVAIDFIGYLVWRGTVRLLRRSGRTADKSTPAELAE